MKLKHLGLFLCLFIGGAAAAQEAEFRDAVRYYRSGQWSAAYGRLIVLANNGHRDAARMALYMYQYGPVLYGTPWDASEEDVELWTRTAGSWKKPGEAERVASARPPAQAPSPNARPRATPFQGRTSQR